MPPKRVVRQLRESYKEASNLRSELLPPQVIDPDHTNKRMNPSRTDSFVLLLDGAPPSPHSPTGFIPTSDGPASYTTFSKNVKEANSRRELEIRLAETAAEAQTAATKVSEANAKAQQEITAKEARRLAYFALVKQQYREDMDAQKANFFDDEDSDVLSTA
jgi:membrane-bound lytic murein transglycosylase